MANKRSVEIYSAGCPVCDEAVKRIKVIACPSCEVTVLDMREPIVATRAAALGIRSLPAFVIDGKLADCCAGPGPDETALRAEGVGQPIP